MSKFNRGKLKDSMVFVPLNNLLYYGFNIKDASSIAGVSLTDLTACGHVSATAIADNDTKVLVFSPNSPKPQRFTKKLKNAAGQQQSFSTFVGYASKKTALTAGFKPVAGSGAKVNLRANPSSGGSKISAIAEMENGLMYVWSMDSADFGTVKADLGLLAAADINTDAEKKMLVVAPGAGCQPGRAKKELAEGSISSFYSFGKELPAGWSQVSSENLGIDGYTGAAPAPGP